MSLVEPIRSGLIVVQRVDWFAASAPGGARPSRDASVSLSHEEVFRRFRGIEGFLWPDLSVADLVSLHEGLAAPSATVHVKHYLARLGRNLSLDTLLVSTDLRSARELQSSSQLEFLGFDFGFLTDVGNNYSIVLNEVIYGQEARLRDLSPHLNESLLLQDRLSIELLRRERTRLVKAGRDLESDDREPEGFAIYDCTRYLLSSAAPAHSK